MHLLVILSLLNTLLQTDMNLALVSKFLNCAVYNWYYLLWICCIVLLKNYDINN